MINRTFLDEDIKKGQISLYWNTNSGKREIGEIILFLNNHPEVMTINISHSYITQELAEALAIIPTIKKINLLAHTNLSSSFYRNSDPMVVNIFKRKTGQITEIPTLRELSLFAAKQIVNPDLSKLPEDLKTNFKI